MVFWDQSSFIKPSIRRSSGKGTDRIYNFRDIVALRVAWKLRRAGISLQALRSVVAHLQQREGLDSPLSEIFLASDGSDVFEMRGDEVLALLRRPGQTAFAWVLDLRGVVEELHALIAA